ncbi:hypothetical protein [Microbacterium invictum]|uniref:Uncharacterized protein n=1 Tax=Microbacterium invictum TaxID=515415 RepID=A0ABZ0VBP1_9MICO|nr:hypothetical protein [Microbacterium invictum]WQB70217.1 hypothetical protein T9R20_16190 [Microbacterium invictum]
MSEQQIQKPAAQDRAVPIGVVMVGMSLVVWWPAFTLGAWGDLFFDQLLTLWAASTAALVFVLVERAPVGGKLGRALLLLVPSLWIVLSYVFNEDERNLGVLLVSVGAVLMVIVALPFTMWVLVRIVWPDFRSFTRRSTRWLILGVVGGIAIVSFVLGVTQSEWLYCEDFAISGNSEPPGCTPEPPGVEE